ncbi:hypothetical protein Ancab_024459 [Ancistrocladus abbreviatus]
MLNSLTKKQLYRRLSDHPPLVDDATMSFWLEKWSGKKCYMIAARNLAIEWGNAPSYWRWTSVSESGLPEVAELISVSWFEIRGKMKTFMLSTGTACAAYLVFKMTKEAYGFYTSVNASVGTVGGKTETQSIYLDPYAARKHALALAPAPLHSLMLVPIANLLTGMQASVPQQFPKQRSDGWLETRIGQFFTEEENDEEVEMSVLEIKSCQWKGGLNV